MTRKHFIALAIVLLVAQARPAGKFAPTVDTIMRGPGLVGYEPEQARWGFDSRSIYFQWKRYTDDPRAPMDTYVVNRDGSGLRRLTPEEARAAPPVGGDVSQDQRLTVFARDGDVFVYDNTNGQTRQITRTAEEESNPHFLPDAKRIYFTRGGNLYGMSLETGALEQMTDIQAGAPAAATAASASQESLKAEQKSLFETVREREALHQAEEARRKQESPRKPLKLEARQTAADLRLSPDGKYVLATINEPGGAKSTVIPNWITDTGYVADINGRPYVGDAPGQSKMAVIDAVSGEVKWVDAGQSGPVRLSAPQWSPDGSKVFVLAHAADNKDTWTLALDPATGKTRVIDHEHDDAWVRNTGPEGPMTGWMNNGREIYVVSERTGYAQLYAAPWEGGAARALTTGKWEVLGLERSRDGSRLYITGNRETPFENHLYEMSGEGGPLTRITSRPGKHAATVSPDGGWIADLYSYTNQPTEVYAQENRAGAEGKRLTVSPAPEFGEYPWQDAPIVKFRARDGVEVPARLFQPAGLRPGGPAVVFVHGAGYLQNVDRWWSTHYYREYMFHHVLMERGFTVIDVDYRGSAGYGRDWRTAIYEHMGGKDLDDAVDAAKYLVAEHGVDARKIGIYGGSYGGFLTLMGMFTAPEVFAAGAALRPVSDWALYNHGYTSNILNLPQGDAEAYRRSSPIYFAEGLKGALLICHGMVDTNVEFEDTVRLVERLIELRKQNWDLAVYPVEDHAFVEAASWADEYQRILGLFERNLK